jgi:hypothetical protein
VKKKTTRKTTRKAAPRKGIFPSIDQLTKDVDTAGKLIHVFGAASSSGNFYHDVLKASPIFNSPQACHDLDMLEPVTRDAVRQVIAEAAKLGHKLVPVETYRSQARQAYFFRKHLTRIPRVGCHHFGLACDLAMMDTGAPDPRGEHYAFMRHLAETSGLISGIDWGTPTEPHSFRDWDHVQRVTVEDQRVLFAETWYPASDYRPLERLHRTRITEINDPILIQPARRMGLAHTDTLAHEGCCW